ncbi:fic family toxin-antitoxin system, toxin component [Streptomyces sp. NPDC088354]|uniref:fic family toxin-antitoxin system, toxin component n=1 Tax=Streptomyces sp. NPDC088354 TaxID=3365856 RepID=UPI00382FFD1D
MHLAIDLGWILEVARNAGPDYPAPEDFGVPLSAVNRHKVQVFDQGVQCGTLSRAAALAHTLGLRWLERSNMTVANAVAVAYLQAAGRTVKPGREEIGVLVDELRWEDCTVQSVVSVLRSWPS